MDYDAYAEKAMKEISETIGDGTAVNALSGGVDSSVVTILGHRAIGDRLKTIFVDNGLMREGEPEYVKDIFEGMGIHVDVVEASDKFFNALKGVLDPEAKREAVTQTFYKDVFGPYVRKVGAIYLFQGTILTDIDETAAGIKRQHNIFTQIGIDPQEAFGYNILEPLRKLRKDGVRAVGKILGLPEELYDRIPFPGPSLATRVVGEVTREEVELVRKATAVVEDELKDSGAFQYFAVLLNDRATGMRDGKRDFGRIMVVRSVDSVDARTATATKLDWDKLDAITSRIIDEVPGVVRVLYETTPKPVSTIEFI